MKILAFEPEYNAKHREVLHALVEGIPNAEIRPLGEYEDCDIAIIFGSYKESYPPTFPKKEILEKHQGRRLLMVESGFVRRGEYYQVGWGGFAGNADFNNHNSPIDRWLKMEIDVKPWQYNPDGHVIVIGQVPWDTQVQHTDHVKWCRDTIAELERMGERVVFRPHPKLVHANKAHLYGIDDKYFDEWGKFPQAAQGAKCVVTYNSTSAVDSLIEGVPVIACDNGSIVGISKFNIKGMLTPHNYPCPDSNFADMKLLYWNGYKDMIDYCFARRKQLFANIGYAQWTLEEMRRGETWRHLVL